MSDRVQIKAALMDGTDGGTKIILVSENASLTVDYTSRRELYALCKSLPNAMSRLFDEVAAEEGANIPDYIPWED